MLCRFITIAVFLATLANAAEPVRGFDRNRVYGAAMEAARRADYGEAAVLCRELWDNGTSDIDRASAAQDLGMILHYSGDDAQARVWLERAFEGWRRVPGRPERLPQVMQELGMIYRRLGDYTTAERFFRDALVTSQISAMTRMKTLNSLSDLLREQGRVAEARELLRKGIEPSGLLWTARIESLMAIASVEREAGNAQDSADHWNQALEIARGNQSIAFEAMCMRGLAETWLERRDVTRALPLLRRSVYLLESIQSRKPTGQEVFQLANARRALAEALLRDGKPVQAEEMVQHAIDEMVRASDGSHPQAAALFDTLADTLAAQGKLERALQALERSRAILAAHFGESSTLVVIAAAKRGVLEERGGQPEAAVRHLESALKRMDRDHPDLAKTRFRLLQYYAAALQATHRNQEAKAVRAEIKTCNVE